MSRITTNSVNLETPANVPAPVVATPEERALNLAVGAAVKTLNLAAVVGEGREITWTFDSQSRRPVIKVVESQTREVITQWPAQYALDLAAEQNKQQPNFL